MVVWPLHDHTILLLRLLFDNSKRKTQIRTNFYSKKKEEFLLIIKGKTYKEKLHSWYCRHTREVNHVKWKPLFAVLLGLLMAGMTAGSAMAEPVNSSSGSFGHLLLRGVYDPAPGGSDSVLHKALGELSFSLVEHRISGWIVYNGRRASVSWKYNLFKSADFGGYALFQDDGLPGLRCLEVVIYANGTIWVFAKDPNGGLIALKGNSQDLFKAFSHIHAPVSHVSDRDWLWNVLPPHVEKREVPLSHTYQYRPSVMSSSQTSTTQKTFEYEYTVGWWIFKSTLYIDVVLELHGPTNLYNNGMYGFDIRILDEGEISNGQKHSKSTPLFVGEDGTSLTKPVEVGIVVPHSTSLSLEIQKIFFDYVGSTVPSLDKIGWGGTS